MAEHYGFSVEQLRFFRHGARSSEITRMALRINGLPFPDPQPMWKRARRWLREWQHRKD